MRAAYNTVQATYAACEGYIKGWGAAFARPPPLYVYSKCCICSLCCRLHTHGLCAAYVQLKCAHMWPRYVAKYIHLVTRIILIRFDNTSTKLRRNFDNTSTKLRRSFDETSKLRQHIDEIRAQRADKLDNIGLHDCTCNI